MSDNAIKLILQGHFHKILSDIFCEEDETKYILASNYLIKILEDGANAIIAYISDDCINAIANMFLNLLDESFDVLENDCTIYDYIKFDEPNIYLVCAIIHYNNIFFNAY